MDSDLLHFSSEGSPQLPLETNVRCHSISEFVFTWLQQNTNCDIDSVLEKQGHEGEYANELFIRGTSLFLGIAISFKRNTSTFFSI